MQTSPVNFSADLNIPARPTGEVVPNPKVTQPTRIVDAKTSDKAAKTDDLAKLKDSLAEHGISLKFTRDEQTKAMVVEMIDEKTGDAIRQFPSAVSLKLAANYIRLQGQFINRKK